MKSVEKWAGQLPVSRTVSARFTGVQHLHIYEILKVLISHIFSAAKSYVSKLGIDFEGTHLDFKVDG